MLRVPADITNQPEKVQSARKEAVRALCFLLSAGDSRDGNEPGDEVPNVRSGYPG
jgi:hypothetical protein